MSDFLRVDRLAEKALMRLLEKQVGPATAALFGPMVKRESRRLRQFNPSKEVVESAKEILQRARSQHAG